MGCMAKSAAIPTTIPPMSINRYRLIDISSSLWLLDSLPVATVMACCYDLLLWNSKNQAIIDVSANSLSCRVLLDFKLALL